MAKSNIYAIQDVLIGFHAPMIAANDEAMVRDYKNWASKQMNAPDMRLFKLGTFDDQTGEITAKYPEIMIGGITNGDQD